MSMRTRVGAILSLVLMACASGGPASAAGANSWEELTAQWLEAAFHQPGGRWAVTVLAAPPGWVVSPQGGIEILGMAHGVNKPKKIMTLAVSRKNGARAQLRVQSACLIRVPVAGRLLPRGAVLAPGDFRWEERDGCGLPADAVRAERAVAGQRVKKFLAAGEVISEHALEPVPDVVKGKKMTLRIVGEGVVISADAEAQEEGCLGKTIRVKLLDNGKIMTARIAGNAAAELALTDRR